MSADRYGDVNRAWQGPIPACSRAEAERAARALYRKFMVRDSRSTYDDTPERRRFGGKVRRCWITTQPRLIGLDRGWPRLVHDVSHRVFSYRYPDRRPHDALHARLEKELTDYVLASGWLQGKLKPKAKAKRATNKLAHTEALLKKWRTRAARAKTAISKLERRRKQQMRNTPTKAAAGTVA